MSNQYLSGKRLYLRPMVEDDAEAIARSAILETETDPYETGRIPSSDLAFRHWIRDTWNRQPRIELIFAACRIGEDDCIGILSLRHIDGINGTAETGTGFFNPVDRGQGYGTEAKNLLLGYTFETLGLHAIHSSVYSANLRSQAALRKQGYRLAGRLRAQEHRGGRYTDRLIFDLLREDWLAASESQS